MRLSLPYAQVYKDFNTTIGVTIMLPDPERRTLLKTATAAAVCIPLSLFISQARAATNPAIRAQLKYQDTPNQGNACDSCLEFVPGKTDKDLGKCKVIPGDDEISPKGYCTAWNTM
jgi:hypothetical protein